MEMEEDSVVVIRSVVAFCIGVAGTILLMPLAHDVSDVFMAQSCTDFVKAMNLHDEVSLQHAALVIQPLLDDGADRTVVSIAMRQMCIVTPRATVDEVATSLMRNRGLVK